MTQPTTAPVRTADLENKRVRFDQAHAALAEEHAQIIALLNDLTHNPDQSLLVSRLKRLHTLLVNHFAHEQFPGGLYESMGAFGSCCHDDLRELIREHCLILSEARAVLERAQTMAPDALDELNNDVMALSELLFRHEHKEHRLAERLKSAANGEST